jgi:hypothetical protein
MRILLTISKYLDIAGPLLGLLLSAHLLFGKKKAGGYFAVLSYFLLQLIMNSVAKYMSAHYIVNIKIYQANAFFSLAIISWWFLPELKQVVSPKRHSLLRWFAGVSVCILIPILLLEDAQTLNSHSLSFTSLCVCFYCMIFYAGSLINLDEGNLVYSRSFWIVTAFFLYYSTCFFIYISFKIFTKDGYANFGILWSIHNFILFITCCILAIASKKK